MEGYVRSYLSNVRLDITDLEISQNPFEVILSNIGA